MAEGAAGLVASFRYLDALLAAIEQLKRAGRQELQTFSPVPHHAIDEALAKPVSPVRVFTLVGAILGGTTAVVLTVATSLHYPLITGGKPIVSIPPYLVIVFELTILFGGLFTLAGMLINARLPRIGRMRGYHPVFSEDRFGLWVGCSQHEEDGIRRILEAAGAEEVRRVGG